MIQKLLKNLDLLLIFAFSMLPLFSSFPYRVNIFLSWEGAYRMSQGQIPFEDFGTPLGGAYWLIPALFMKIFGPGMLSLIKAQVLINIMGGLAFRGILKELGAGKMSILLGTLVYALSYILMNFWPWYNHSVIIFQLVGFYFLLAGMNKAEVLPQKKQGNIFFILAGLFFTLSFLTKQDGGALGFLGATVLAMVHAFFTKKWKIPILLVSSFAATLIAYVYLTDADSFNYWFNRGQAPHSSRVSLMDISTEFLAGSQWIKFYLLLIVFLEIASSSSWKQWLQNKSRLIFFLFTLFILAEAAIFQVTSYTPPDNNIFYHSFAVAYLFYQFSSLLPALQKPTWKIATLFLVFLWWSPAYWKYIERILYRINPPEEIQRVSKTGENLINKNTYALSTKDSKGLDDQAWIFSDFPVFQGIYMPAETASGMQRLKKMFKDKGLSTQPSSSVKVLNMSELTPLAHELGFELERNPALPLWHHLGVGMFNKQAEIYEKRIQQGYYDCVIFEHIPNLNNFYPFRVRDQLLQVYEKVDSFTAPRRGDTQGSIEVFLKR